MRINNKTLLEVIWMIKTLEIAKCSECNTLLTVEIGERNEGYPNGEDGGCKFVKYVKLVCKPCIKEEVVHEETYFDGFPIN
jgi:hypothetical protein